MSDLQCVPQREKYWSELDDAGRTERLRIVVRQIMRQMDSSKASIRRLKDAIEVHEHSVYSGKPVLHVETYDRSQCDEARPRRINENPDECFI